MTIHITPDATDSLANVEENTSLCVKSVNSLIKGMEDINRKIYNVDRKMGHIQENQNKLLEAHES